MMPTVLLPGPSNISPLDARPGRQAAMAEAQRSYDGTPPNQLTVRGGETDDNLKLSLGRLIVDKGVSFLFGQDVLSQIPDPLTDSAAGGTGTPRSAPARKKRKGGSGQQDWLDECWRRNKRALTLAKLATNGGICGHAFARLLDTEPYPRVVVLDPQTVDVRTDPDDIDDVWRYTITPPPQLVDEDEPPERRRTVIQTNRNAPVEYRPQTWTITDQIMSGGAWVNVASRPWPHPFSPIADAQNLPRANDFWGESDLPQDILHALNSLNRVASHVNKILRVHAHPKIFTTGMGQRTIDTAIDTVINLPSETSDLRSLEMQSDLASSLNFLDRLLNYISMMARIPLVAMGMPDSLGAISGVALQIRYQPLLEKTHMKRRTYGDMLVELDRRLLAMGGFNDTTVTQLVWHEMLPTDPLMERQVLVLDDSLGIISKQGIAEKLGYDYDTETALMAEEDAAALAKQQAAGLPAAGDGGSASTGGTVAQAVGGGPQSEQPVPPPAPFKAPLPDIAARAKSR